MQLVGHEITRSTVSYCWLDVRTFAVGDGTPPRAALERLVAQPEYADLYLSGEISGGAPGHGRYRLDAVDMSVYEPVSVNQVVAALVEAAAQRAEDLVVPSHLAASASGGGAAAWFALADPIPGAGHDSAWVLDLSVEFVAVDSGAGRVTVVVLGSD